MTSSSADEIPRTLEEVLDVCRPTIVPALIDPPHLAALSDICRRLPKQFSGFWGLEVALGDPRAQADLLIELKRDSLRHTLLAGGAPSALDALCATMPAWAELRRFATAWAERSDARRELVRNVWVEFDLIAAAESTPPVDPLARPSVFWGPESMDRDGWPRFTALAEYLSETFAPFPKALPLSRLQRAVQELPPGARVFQLGAMQLRGAVMLRLCINDLQPADVPAWLEAQGWSGDAQALRVALDALVPLVRVFAVDVDYTADGIGPKIGLECYLQWGDLNPAQWQPLCDHLSRLGLCVASKRDAIAAFPATTEYPLSEQIRGEGDGFMFPVIYRNIHHVKASFVDGAFRDAKAYLGITRPGVKIGLPRPAGPAAEADEWLST